MRWTRTALTTLFHSFLLSSLSISLCGGSGIVARDDAFEVSEDSGLVIPSPGVLANDSVLAGETGVTLLLTAATNGIVNLEAGGGFSYFPKTNYFGGDSFSYRIIAPGVTSMPAVVGITVRPVSDPPRAVSSATALDEDQPARVELNAEDPDGDALQFEIVTPPTRGWVFILAASGVNAAAEYRPFPDVSGEDAFTWKVRDGTFESATLTVSVMIRPVADVPLARPDEWFVLANTPVGIPAPSGVLANDYDAESQALAAMSAGAPQHGTLELRADGSFRYVPSAGFAGVDRFSYVAAAGVRTSVPAQVVLRVGDERWSDGFAGSPIQSLVYALLPSPLDPGHLFVGGAFRGQLGGSNIRGVALWDGDRWQALGNTAFNGVDGNVRALAWFDGSLYAGGELREAGGRAALNIARWDGSRWHAAGGGLNDDVFALAVNETNLFAGGSFRIAGGKLARGVARWDGAAWFALGDGLEGTVASLTFTPSGTLFAAANVRSGDTITGQVWRWDGAVWARAGEGFDGPINALAFSGDDLVAAGRFAAVGTIGATNVARWNGSAWSAMGLGIPDEAGALTVHQGQLYAGQVHNSDGFSVPMSIYQWDGQFWTALPQALQAEQYPRVLALAGVDGALFAGGVFTRAGNAIVEHLARWDGTNWHGLSRALCGGTVAAIAVRDADAFVAGTFASAAEVPVRRVARWDGSRWFPLGSGDSNGVNGVVHALATKPGTDLFAGGEFSEAGGRPASNAARWDGTSWNALGTGTDGAVRAMALASDGSLYAGGEFRRAGGQTARGIAQWNGAAWSEPGGGVNGPVFALLEMNRGMIAAGAFQEAGGTEARCIALWDGTQWHPFGEGISSLNGIQVIYALAVRGREVFAAGEFSLAGGNPVQHLARWDGERWHALATAVTRPGWMTSVRALGVHGGSVFAGGVFSSIDASPVSGIARWDGASWSSLGSGVEGNDESVVALAVRGNQLLAGGSFALAGGRPSRDFAIWSLLNTPPEVQIARPLSGSSFFTGGAITLRAQAADPDGSVRRVDFYANHVLVGSSTSAPFEIVWRDVFAGSYDLVAVAEDEQGERGYSIAVPVTVRPPFDNQAPAVGLAVRAAVNLGETISLEAQASDPDGSIREVRFFRDGQLLGAVAQPPYTLAWTAATAGIFHFTAVAEDNLGAVTASAPAIVRVQNPPEVFMSSPSDGSVYGLPARVDLVADARDFEGPIAQVDFLTNGVFFATAVVYSSPDAYFWWENPPVGQYAIHAIAFDEDGASTASKPVNITVLGTNRPPVITLLSPVSGGQFGLPTNMVIRVEAEDPDGEVREIQFFDGGVQLARLTNRPYAFVLKNLVPGSYDLQAKAIDDRGDMAASAISRITTTNDPARVPKYQLIDLGTLGGDSSYAFGINQRGDVVGQAMRADRSEHGFLRSGETMRDLGNMSNRADDSSQALHINNLGWITGSSSDNRSGETRAFLLKGTNYTDLGTLGGRFNVAFRINESGQIAGASQDRGDRFRAFIFDRGKLKQITDEGRESFAYGLNNDGTVVGKIEGHDGIIRAFRYDPASGVQPLGGFTEDYSEARGINDSGNITGKLSGTRGWEAFLWLNGYVVELGGLGGGMSEAYALNNHNQVVGRSPDRRSPMAAFLWHGGVMHNLNALIPPDPRWQLTIAYDINDAGDIVGEGEWTSPATGTQRRAFLLRLAPDSPVRPEDNRFLQVVDSQFSALVPVLRGQPLVIEATDDLEHWQPVSTNYNRTGVVDFSDPDSRGALQRFYRIVPLHHPAQEAGLSSTGL